ncbi:MAG: DMT family transporter [Spirochaetales bacterium]|nr:DMT family transporter [Spirochaetales bacterium]
MTYIGEIAALITAACWAFGSLSFEASAKRIGSLSLNLIRLFMTFFMICIYSLIRFGNPFPVGVSGEQWLWLSLSGFVGFYLGDITFFKAFEVIGARTSMAIYSTVPVFTAIMGYFLLGETMSMLHLGGMFIAISGVILVVVSREPESGMGRDKLKFGVLMAFLGTLGQAGGLILSKKGMTYDPFIATQVRTITAIVLFSLTFTIIKRWGSFASGLRDSDGMKFAGLGAFFGPFLGVSLALLAIQYTSTGIASTLIGLTPIILIPLSVFLKKERVNFREILGTVIAIGGSSILFIKG